MRSKKKIGQIILNGVFLAMMCIYIMPILTLVSSSFTDETALIQGGYSILPSEFSLKAYEAALRNPMQMIKAYGVTILVCAVSTALSTLIMALLAYPLSRSNFLWKKQLNFMVYFTMLFNGGMVPTYLLISNVLKINNTIWALILPLAFNSYNIIVMRTFFQKSVPDSIIESARIDGASEFRIFIKIVIPLAIPGIATIALFSTLAYWNDWFNSLLYIDYQNLVPLQHMLMKIEKNMEFIRQNAMLSGEVMSALPQESVRMAMVVVSTLPIACTYPFFQKYFISGLTVGGVKE